MLRGEKGMGRCEKGLRSALRVAVVMETEIALEVVVAVVVVAVVVVVAGGDN